MAYDETLAERVRDLAGGLPEKKTFGGLAFLLDGNMAVGVMGDDLLVRCGPDDQPALLTEPGVRPFVMGGRTSAGWLVVAGEVLEDDVLRTWIGRGVAFAGSLPPK
ncbi:MAG TPA: TfoX/Sxy family protein [Mycobacteriales bacterium]|jgi:TfoX/Sxy family transcriptional regulator of competence genes|nr:TfoX/Sxy family protein [Mycobacteriales bacterium]